MSEPDDRPEGPREETRRLLLDAARRLIASQGVEATTIRQIAEAAGLTERTFYRYFDGKEGLVAEEALAWIDVLHQAIRDRPGEEAPYVAIRRAMAQVATRQEGEFGGAPLWLFGDRPRARRLLPRATTRPLQRLETAISGALLARDGAALGDPAGPDVDPRFAAQVLARLAAGALRSAVIRHRQLEAGEGGSPGVAALLDQAFSLISAFTTADHP